jgi:hypothetical protein
VGTSKHILGIYLGRLLMGLGMGVGKANTFLIKGSNPRYNIMYYLIVLGTSAVSVVLTEMSSPRWRGALTMAKNVSFSVGLTLIYILGLSFRVSPSLLFVFIQVSN